MTLLQRLSARKAAFYFVERGGVAYAGSRQLSGLAARWLNPGDPFAELPDVLPVWQGSFLPFQAALQRWGFPEVWVVLIGCADAERRSGLVSEIRKNRPLGL